MKCVFCNGVISIESLVIEDGLEYHDQCSLTKCLRERSGLEKLIRSGRISLEQNERYKDLCQIIENKNTHIPGIPKEIYKKSDQLITRPQERLSAMRSSREAEFKRLEAARAERWAWEAMTTIETQLALSWKELFQITDGKP